MSGADDPRGQNFDVNRNLLSLRSFAIILKKNLFEVWFYAIFFMILYIFFHDFIHVYSPRAGADNPLGMKFWCQQEDLVTFIICYKFQKNLHDLSVRKFWCQQKPLVTSVICYKFKKNSLWSLILYNFFHDFIHVYSPRAGADSPQGTKFSCQQKCLVTSFICCKFQKNVFEVWFYTIFFMI